jgi:hypothetical protein
MFLESKISVRKTMHSDFLTVFSDFLGPFNLMSKFDSLQELCLMVRETLHYGNKNWQRRDLNSNAKFRNQNVSIDENLLDLILLELNCKTLWHDTGRFGLS